MANYTYITASKQIKVGAGKLRGIFVSSASSTPTITIYDVQTGTATTMVGVFTPVGATFYPFGSLDGAFFNQGLNVVISGTVAATVIYE
jgi:hypothetical protein